MRLRTIEEYVGDCVSLERRIPIENIETPLVPIAMPLFRRFLDRNGGYSDPVTGEKIGEAGWQL